MVRKLYTPCLIALGDAPEGVCLDDGMGYFSCWDDGVARDFLPRFSGSIWVYLLGCRDEEKWLPGKQEEVIFLPGQRTPLGGLLRAQTKDFYR